MTVLTVANQNLLTKFPVFLMKKSPPDGAPVLNTGINIVFDTNI